MKIKFSKLLFIASMGIFGTIAIFIKNIPIPSGEIALYRALLASILIAVFFIIRKQPINLKKIKASVPILLISGAAMGFNWIFLFEAYNYTSVSTATLSYYFAPILVTIVSPVLFKEKLTLKQIICFIMSTVGIILITDLTDLNSGSTSIFGICLGLAAAVLYATVIILNKFLKNIDGITRTFLQFLSAICVLIPYVLFTGGINIGELKPIGWGALLFVGLIHTGVTYCIYFSTMKDLDGQSVAILSYIDPLVAVFISVFVLGETMSIPQIIGGAMILGFTLINEIPFKTNK